MCSTKSPSGRAPRPAKGRLTWTWCLLLLATLLTWQLGESGLAGRPAVLVLLGIAVAKGWGITEQFMELRHGPLLWRLLIGGWVVVMALLLGSIFLFLSV